MAGRGTDIMLGGNSEFLAKEEMRKNRVPAPLVEEADTYYETDDQDILRARETFKKLVEKYDEQIKEEKEKVIAAGGLKIIGTERHESRRIDNQLRGRSGRQGDPGETRFYLALDDNLLKIFGGDIITKIFERGNVPEDMPIEVKLVSKSIENAQSKVEGRNFSIRKHILSYDDVMNVQREIIYSERRKVLEGANLHDNIVGMIEDSAEAIVATYSQEIEDGTLQKDVFLNEVQTSLNIDKIDSLEKDKLDAQEILSELKEKALAIYSQKEKDIGEDIRELERVVVLKIVDSKWMDHIDAMDELKNGIGLRAYGQKDPVVQYRFEGGEMFDEMNLQIKLEVAKIILHIVRNQRTIKRQSNIEITSEGFDNSAMETIHLDKKTGLPQSGPADSKPQPIVNEGPKIGRNDPCPCGSGKKYKNCHGRNA